MNFLPRVPESLEAPLVRALHELGRSPLTRVQALRRPADLGHYLISNVFGTESRLTVVLSDMTGSGVAGAIVAARALEHDEELSLPGPLVSLPLGVLGRPAILHPLPPGRPADARGSAEQALHAIGRVLDVLARRPQPSHGTVADNHRFHPRRGTWGEEWLALCERWTAMAEAGGTALHPMVDALTDELDPTALSTEHACLVPGGLAPGSVWLDGDGEITAVDGWLPSWSGDSWSAWAPLLHLPAPALTAVRLAHEEPPTLSSQAERLAVYAAGHVLFLLATAASAPGPHERTHALERAHLAFEARASLRDRLEAADSGEPRPGPLGTARAPVLAVMDRLVREPQLTRVEEWLAIAGTVVLAHRVGGVAGLEGWQAVAQRAVASLEPGLGPAVLEHRSLPAHEHTSDPVLRWLVQELREANGGHAPAGYDAAIDSLTRRLPPERRSTADQLQDAILGMAALRHLDRESEIATLRSQAEEAWESLDFGVTPPVVEPLDVLRAYADPARHDGCSRPVGLLLLALARGGLPLPCPWPALLHTLGLTPL